MFVVSKVVGLQTAILVKSRLLHTFLRVLPTFQEHLFKEKCFMGCFWCICYIYIYIYIIYIYIYNIYIYSEHIYPRNILLLKYIDWVLIELCLDWNVCAISKIPSAISSGESWNNLFVPHKITTFLRLDITGRYLPCHKTWFELYHLLYHNLGLWRFQVLCPNTSASV